jgi:hypothetical protein
MSEDANTLAYSVVRTVLKEKDFITGSNSFNLYLISLDPLGTCAAKLFTVVTIEIGLEQAPFVFYLIFFRI